MKIIKLCLLIIIFGSTALRTVAQDSKSLKVTFKPFFLIGAALNQSQFSGKDEPGASIVKEQFNTITPENILKWENVHPEQDKYTFEEPDKYVAFGEKNDMFVIGHTLVWHAQTPRWVFWETMPSGKDSIGKPASREMLLDRMHDHINKVVSRYKGRIKGWDVVNEALNEDGTLRQSLWMKIIGEDFIEKAFQFAHEADPGAELYYNDFSIENPAKRNGAIELIKKLKSKGIEVSGVGIQGHYKMDWPTTGLLDSTIKAFAEIGVKVMITELDIDALPAATWNRGADISLNVERQAKLDPYKTGFPDSVQNALSKRYADLFTVLVNNKDNVKRVTFWGVRDNDSWLNNWPVRGRTSYPLLFDRDGKPKPAFDAVINTVKNISGRTTK